MNNERAGAGGAEVKPGFGRALVVTAHPDDPEFLFGATVAWLAAGGAEVFYLICSDGANGSRDPARPKEEIAAVRAAEQRAAAGLLGVRGVVFLNLPDGRLAPSLDLRFAIARELRRVRPDLVITHFPRRVLDIPLDASHPDHVAVGEAALSAVMPDASNARAFPELLREGLEPHKVKEVWVPGYEQPNHCVDAAPFLERKAAAIMCHRSQLGDPPPAGPPPWLYHFMGMVGARHGYEYGEDFRRIVV
ncbi:MAG TPA: PIG-L deacetylase family protein [Pyrinomonadaceae bacterium]|nr:PIG-L deacetylase family protein [Pyrinomonadaceae bacterium]